MGPSGRAFGRRVLDASAPAIRRCCCGGHPAGLRREPGGPRLAGPLAADAEPADVDKADIDRSQIIGNRELPKVLYIVPWKKPMPGDLSGRPLESVLDEALAPVDRDVFRRQVNYQEQSKANSKTQDAAKTEAPSGK